MTAEEIIVCGVIVALIGVGMLYESIRMGREGKQAWKAFDMVYPPYWSPGDCEGNWKVTITMPPDHSKPDVSVDYEDNVVRSWRELN